MQTRAVVSSVLLVQALDDVLLGELEVVVGRDVLLEFLERLVAEVAAVDQEQHAPRAGELDQAVDEGDGGEGLAGAGGHLDQGARAVFRQGFFEVVDRRDLGGPEAFFLERRHVLAGARGRWRPRCRRDIGSLRLRAFPVCADWRLVVRHRASRPAVSGLWKANTGRERGRGVEAVGEAGFDAGGLVGKRQRVAPARQARRAGPWCICRTGFRHRSG